MSYQSMGFLGLRDVDRGCRMSKGFVNQASHCEEANMLLLSAI